MSIRAWTYIWFVLLVGILLTGLAFMGPLPELHQWIAFVILTSSAAIAQQFEANLGRQSYYPSIVFMFAGVVLLPTQLFILLVAIPHLIEWAKKRWSNSKFLRDWYIQPFNIAVHIIAGVLSQAIMHAITGSHELEFSYWTMLGLVLGGLSYVILNHFLIGQVLVLARNISWRDSQIMSLENILTEFILFSLGYTVAIFWQLSPMLIIPATSPLLLLYQALRVPQLKQEAQTDSKTGLFNARHFNKVFGDEFERAKRFNRPLAFIMADLDLMRNINNTYGHLAGDIVLAKIGEAIRETIREYDIAGRFGGEEFALALPETDIGEARSIAERVRRAIEAMPIEVSTSPTPIHVTLSVGVACFPHDAHTLTDLTHAADVAVYQAKFHGRNRVVCASDIPHSQKLELMARHSAQPESAKPSPVSSGDGAPTQEPSAEPTGESQPAPSGKAQPTHPVDPAPPSEPAAEQYGPALHATAPQPKGLLWLFVGGVISIGLTTSMIGNLLARPADLTTIGLLAILALLAELFQINLYGSNTVSVSVSVAFASALIAGMPGITCTSAAIALAHTIRRRPPLYRAAFNWATHVLAGTLPAVVAIALPIQPGEVSLLFLVVPFILVALIYYIVDTGLVARHSDYAG
jgi:diguanylate cyclase (GGDEF)-like protein